MNLSFVYPIYNEIDNLPRLFSETQRIVEGITSDFELVLVDDGSTDGSGAFIAELAERQTNVRSVHHRRNRGLGAAIRTGLANATKDLVLYMDADFPVSVEEARSAIGLFTDDLDMLIGYRLGRAEGPHRELMSLTYNRLIRWVFGLRVRDVNFAFKLMRRSLIERMDLRSEGSFIDAELLLEARRLGARIQDVGITYHSRSAGVSTAAGFRVVSRIFGEMWRHRHRRRKERPGSVRLIVNADDFGLCEAINRGVIEVFERGIVTSVSLLPTGEAFEDAIAIARSKPELDLGIHLALTQTAPVCPPDQISSLVDRGGRFPNDWRAFLGRYLRGHLHKNHIEAELRAQIERALSTGLSFSHINSHQHVHVFPRVLPIVTRLAHEYDIGAIRRPRQGRSVASQRTSLSRLLRGAELRALRLACDLGWRLELGNGLATVDDFRGFAEAGRWSAESLIETVEELDAGVTEIGCHPGADNAVDSVLGWDYRWEQEKAALIDPEVRAALSRAGVRLTTYRDLIGSERCDLSP